MRILFISNYKFWLNYVGREKPTAASHHMFGMYQLIERFAAPNRAVLRPEIGGGTVDFVCYSSPGIHEILELYIKSFQYDVVYDVLNAVSKYFSILNKIHIVKPKLVTIYHHPPFKKMMTFGRSDVSVFFTPKLLQEAESYVHDGRKMFYNRWYPDIEWYDENRKGMDTTKQYDFLDNGKTARDHNKFIRSVDAIGASGVIVTGHGQEPSEYNEGGNVAIHYQDHPNDLNLLQLALHCKVMVVPLLSDKDIVGPIGYTSYMDAIALGMPVVCPSNAAFADEVKEHGLGFVYGKEEENFANALKLSLDNYDAYHDNMLKFKTTHDISVYVAKLKSYLL